MTTRKAAIQMVSDHPIPVGGIYFNRTAVSNRQFAEICNANGVLEASGDGGYSIVNLFNPDIPLIRHRGGTLEVRDGFEEHPVVGVTWHGAQACARLMGGRLPTVSEWEAAASCGDGRTYPWGEDEPTPGHANFDENVGATRAVGSYSPNPLGLYDMAGNVGEWCGPGPDGLGTDPDRPADIEREHPIKGGAWNKPPWQLACSATRYKWGRIGTVGIGFRVVFDERPAPSRHRFQGARHA